MTDERLIELADLVERQTGTTGMEERQYRNAAIAICQEIRARIQESNRPTHPNYPRKSPLELKNEDLQRENDCAAERIARLSRALYELGIDPTQI